MGKKPTPPLRSTVPQTRRTGGFAQSLSFSDLPVAPLLDARLRDSGTRWVRAGAEGEEQRVSEQGLASLDRTANLSGLVLGCSEADFCK